MTSLKPLLASIVLPGVSAWKRRRAAAIALLVVGVLAPIVLPVVLIATSGGIVNLALDSTALGLVRIVLIAVVLSRVVAVAEVLVAAPRRTPIASVGAIVGIVLVAVPSVWAYGRLGEVSDTVGTVFLSSSSNEPLAASSSDDSAFTTVMLIAGEEGDSRFDVQTDSIVLITTHRDSGRTALVSIDGDTRKVVFADGSPLDARHPDGYDKAVSELYLDVQADVDVALGYTRGELAPGAVALAEALSASLDVSIDDYVFVHLDGVRTLVDVLGGISVNSTDGFEIPALDGADAELVEPGRVELNGDQAYRLVSTRTDVSDYEIMIRQRVVIESIGRAVSGSTVVSELSNLLNALKDSMRSSMSGSEFADFLDRFTADGTEVESIALSPDVIDRANPQWSAARTAIDDLQKSLFALP